MENYQIVEFILIMQRLIDKFKKFPDTLSKERN